LIHGQLGGSNVPDHNNMASTNFSTIKTAIKDYSLKYNINILELASCKEYSEIKEDEAIEALAWGGLDGTDNFTKKFGTEDARTADQKKAYDRMKCIQKKLMYGEKELVDLKDEFKKKENQFRPKDDETTEKSDIRVDQ